MPTSFEVRLSEDNAQKGATFEDVLKQTGEFGTYQIRLFIIITLMDITTGQCMSYFVFSNSNPGWRCARYQGSNTTFNETTNFTADACVFNGTKCVEFEFSPELKSITTEWSLVCDQGYLPKMTVSIQMAGVLVGALTSGQVGDTFGRRKTLIAMASLMMVLQIVVGFSNSWQLYAVLRFFVGMATAGTLNISNTLPMEFIGAKYRTFCSSLGVYSMGNMMMALMAYLMRDWRYLAVAIGVIEFPILIAILWGCPESVRWLLQRGRLQEAEDIVKQMAKVNKRSTPDLAILKVIAQGNKELKKREKQYSYHDLFRTRKMGARTAVLLFTWFTASLVTYGISNMYDTLEWSVYLSVVINHSTSMLFGWTVIYTAERFGRRKSYLAYMTIPVVCMVTVALMGALDVTSPDLLTTMVLLAVGGIIACWGISTIHVSELFPTLTRIIGMGACSVAARIGGILAPQVAYLGEFSHWAVPYIFYGTFCIMSAALVFFVLPETQGEPLPENMPARKDSTHRADVRASWMWSSQN
ncbi:solute carrier family 22 member 13-like isoform X1 [Lineus longissimus]|uniref:solute carrier family 22 member 13-like isoform X1 n=1 Tax=Lineus longissimus TaxID=88925 RepID=UPI00315D585A